MPIAVGSNAVSKIYLGSTEVTKAYLGSTEIFSSRPVPLRTRSWTSNNHTDGSTRTSSPGPFYVVRQFDRRLTYQRSDQFSRDWVNSVISPLQRIAVYRNSGAILLQNSNSNNDTERLVPGTKIGLKVTAANGNVWGNLDFIPNDGFFKVGKAQTTGIQNGYSGNRGLYTFLDNNFTSTPLLSNTLSTQFPLLR